MYFTESTKKTYTIETTWFSCTRSKRTCFCQTWRTSSKLDSAPFSHSELTFSIYTTWVTRCPTNERKMWLSSRAVRKRKCVISQLCCNCSLLFTQNRLPLIPAKSRVSFSKIITKNRYQLDRSQILHGSGKKWLRRFFLCKNTRNYILSNRFTTSPKTEIISFRSVRRNWIPMEMKLTIAILAIAAFVSSTNSAGGFNTIGDDELVEQIKSNDFLIVLFCTCERFISICSNRANNFLIILL